MGGGGSTGLGNIPKKNIFLLLPLLGLSKLEFPASQEGPNRTGNRQVTTPILSQYGNLLNLTVNSAINRFQYSLCVEEAL